MTELRAVHRLAGAVVDFDGYPHGTVSPTPGQVLYGLAKNPGRSFDTSLLQNKILHIPPARSQQGPS